MRLAVNPVDEDVVSVYVADLREAGMRSSEHELTWGARLFFSRLGGIDGWRAMPMPQRLAQNVKVHRFVTWMAATQRMALDADYLVARRVHLGTVVPRHWPAFHAEFVETARAVGFGAASITRQWSALCQACALHGVAPNELTHRMLDDAHRQLVAAAQRLGHTGRHLSSAIHGLQATLFHAGVSDELPRKRAMTKESVRVAEWASVPAPLAATMRRYLAQLAVTLRPGTVKRIEITLREFARFLAAHDPAVQRVADVERRHVEAYKLWLVDRPAARAPRLHRHTIRNRLGELRSLFSRLIEWDDPDAPARILVVAADLPMADEPLPRFLDDPSAAKLLQAARADDDPFVRLCVEFLV